MDPLPLEEYIAAGDYMLFTKYFLQATFALVVWDHLITLSDEVEYVWKKEKTWAFWLFIVSRYSILLCKTWISITLFWSGYTQEVCHRTVRFEGYYYVFILTLGLIFLTMRVHALTGTSKYVLVVSGVLVTSSLTTGLWFVSISSAGAIIIPDVPLDPFRACVFIAPETNEWAYRSQVAFADVAAFVFLIVFILRLKADRGQSRMTRLMRTILQGGIHYFFVMAGFHIAMLFLSIFGRPSVIPPIVIMVLTPMLISRLVLTLRKTVDISLVQVWDGDHFTTAETVVHETMDFVRAPPPSTQSSQFPIET